MFTKWLRGSETRELTMYFIIILMSLVSLNAHADDVVDRVYSPHVLPFENDIEWRMMSRQNDEGNDLLQRVAFGTALSENIITEVFLVGERNDRDDFELSSYEVEVRWMLTEQGEYPSDWGILLEVEKQPRKDSWEVSVGLANEWELGVTSLRSNAIVKHLWGSARNQGANTEAELRLQWRYRLSPALQPALELYSDRNYFGIGPAIIGEKHISPREFWNWELAFVKGLNGQSKDHTLRAVIEYKF